MSSTWHIEDDLPGGRETEFAPAGGTVSLAFIAATLRRLWYVWVATAVLGMALAAAFLALVPPPSVGTVTLLLAHDPGTQPDAAMATDVRLLMTRTVAQQLGDELGLDTSPEDLLETILAQQETSSVLQVDITGSDDDDAVRRARLLADQYLAYREEQLTLQSEAVTQGYQQRMDALQAQVDDLSSQYDVVIGRGGSDAEVAELLSLRAQLISEITRLQDQVETETLESNAVVAASRVLDEASLVPRSWLRRAGLSLASGLVGGLGLGLGLVVLYAVTTGRLRSRADVATAMGLPVLYSAGRVTSQRHRLGRRHGAALDLLVGGLESAVPSRGRRPRRLGLVTVDCEREGAVILAALAHRLASKESVLAVDLAGSGLLAHEVGTGHPPASFPPDSDGETTPSLRVVSGPTAETVADVVVSLVTFDIGRGLAHARSMASRWVVLVKTGSSTAERLSTVARAAQTAGLDVQFVMLVGADKSDASFGGAVATESPRGKR